MTPDPAMRIARVLVAALVIALTGCTNAMPRTASFSRTSNEGLLSFALASEVAGTVSLTVARYDAGSRRVTANSFSGQYFVEHHGSTLRHYFIQVPQGKYVIKSVSVQIHPKTTLVCLSQGTIEFDAISGRSLYLGEFVFDGRSIRMTGADLEAAQVAMSAYPGVDGRLQQAEVVKTTFSNSKRLGTQICGG